MPDNVAASAKAKVAAELTIVEEYPAPVDVEFAKTSPAARPNGIIALLKTASRPDGSKVDCEPR
jgi:hypothetical protein